MNCIYFLVFLWYHTFTFIKITFCELGLVEIVEFVGLDLAVGTHEAVGAVVLDLGDDLVLAQLLAGGRAVDARSLLFLFLAPSTSHLRLQSAPVEEGQGGVFIWA